MMKQIKNLIVILLLSLPCLLFSQKSDSSVIYEGHVVNDINGDRDVAKSVIIQPDGKIVSAGISYNTENSEFALIRYQWDGSLDSTFGNNGIVTTDIGDGKWEGVNSITLQPDGKILAAGENTDDEINLVRYNPDGSVDGSFGNNGIVTTSLSGSVYGNSVVLQPNKKILIAGNQNKGDFMLIRYNNDGSLDYAFGNNGVATTGFKAEGKRKMFNKVHCAKIQADGKIVVAGYSWNDSTAMNFTLLRYNNDGSLDKSFGNNGIVIMDMYGNNDILSSMVLQPDGKILAAGTSRWLRKNYDFLESELALIRLNTDGSLDESFGKNGIAGGGLPFSIEQIHSMALRPGGRIIAAGNRTLYVRDNGDSSVVVRDPKPEFVVFHCNSDGSFDRTIHHDGHIAFNIDDKACVGNSVALTANGRVVVVAGRRGKEESADFVFFRYRITQ